MFLQVPDILRGPRYFKGLRLDSMAGRLPADITGRQDSDCVFSLIGQAGGGACQGCVIRRVEGRQGWLPVDGHPRDICR